MTQHERLLVAKNKALYFFPSLQTMDVISAKDLMDDSFMSSFQQQLKQYKLIIFLDYGFDVAFASRIRPHTQAKIILFFWNHFKEEHHQLLKKAEAETAIDDIFHFDILEAKKLGIKHNSSFYSKDMPLPKAEVTTDLFFGATDNGRKQRADDYRSAFEQLGVSTNFYILPSRGNDQEGYLTYTEYLQKTNGSKGILELLREGQSGVTLRTFESIFFNKKLVTDNKAISGYRFYNPQNIFLLGERNLEELPAFLSSPYQTVDREIIEFFDAENWVQRFVDVDPEVFSIYEYSGIEAR
ncbi:MULTISPECIES: oligosaccharide biosynthesis protein Alg14 [unclassified Enterococcus]|uniref:oligosaccharide biosynthesis protein Alg14 n=1 Tax=unclassified Enterococcus TaxID=2608891 RepID=UPI001A9125C1|nr:MULTISPECIES: oligosaccharide biosynthesis protein Alg14 [unclassified Enterococcus]MBO0462512.1 oligosaccharide biosynthesis protein Alg14 [Enterococcus sp. DIV1298c]MBO1300234.1 oligosaccharide biosynthesis protein Alg14 [Enterococcus sp. DIV1271a]